MKIFTLDKIFLFLSILVLGINSLSAQCPIISDTSQSFCDIQSATIASLNAADGGAGIVWYATPTGGTPLASGFGLTNGQTYYADNTAGTCNPRIGVTVTIFRRPDGQAFQGPCVESPAQATLADFVVVGNNIQWYLTPSGGTPLPLSTQLVEGTIYYASQTNPETGCETSRLAVLATVGIVPVPTGPAIQQFCVGNGNTPTVNDLVASGNNNWYLTPSAAVPLDPATPLIDGQFYYATTVDPPCESENRLEVLADLVLPSNAGTSSSVAYCANTLPSQAPVNLFSLLGGNPDNTGVWTGPVVTTNGFLGTLNVSSLTAAGSPYTFTYTVNTNICGPQSATVTVEILPTPVVSVSGSATICSGSAATITFSGTPNATVAYTVDGGAQQTIVLNASGTASITSNYTANTTITLVSVTSASTPACVQAATGTVSINVIPLPTAAISGTVSICAGNSATFTITGTPNAVVTYTVNGGAPQTITLNASGVATITGTFSVTTVFALTSVTSAGTPSCVRPLNSQATVTIIPAPTVTISGTATICQGGTSTVTFTGTPNAVVTYNINGGSPQTIALNGSGTATLTASYANNTTINLVSVVTGGVPACSQPQSGSVIITVLPPPVATVSGSTTICAGQTATLAFNGTPNATVIYTINGGSNQSIVLNGAGVATLTQTYSSNTTITLVSVTSSGTPSCTQTLSQSIQITVVPLPNAAVTGGATLCAGEETTIEFTGTPNAVVTYTLNGVTQTIVLDASGQASLSEIFASTATLQLVSVATSGTPGCNRPLTGGLTISVVPLPTASVSGTQTICAGGNAVFVITGTPNAEVVYSINGGLAQTVVLDSTGTTTISGVFLNNSVIELLLVSVNTPIFCGQILNSSAAVTVLPLPTATLSADQSICIGQTATVAFTGTPNAVVTYTVNGGPQQTITLNAAGTASVTGTYSTDTLFQLVSVATSGSPNCSQPQNDTLLISVAPPPTATLSLSANPVCANTNAVITFTGTPNATVTYTVNGGVPQTIVLDAAGNAQVTGSYNQNTIITLTGVTSAGSPSCSVPLNTSVEIEVLPLPTATITGAATICPNETATITFTGTPGAVVIYSINGAPGQSVTLNNSGTATLTQTFGSTSIITLVQVTSSGAVPCTQLLNSTIEITVVPPPTATLTVSPSQICAGQNVTATITGTANATVFYTVNGTASSVVLNASGTASITLTPTVDTQISLTGAVTQGSPGCDSSLTESLLITVVPLPVASISGTATLCSGATATVSFNGTPNAVISYSINGGPEQTISLDNSGVATLTQSYTQTTVVTLVGVTVNGGTSCSQQVSGSVTLTVVPLPTATISVSPTALCAGSTANIFFSGTPGATINYSINSGATQTTVLSAAGTAVVNVALSGSATVTLLTVINQGSPACEAVINTSVDVLVTPPPVAGNDVTNLVLCANSLPTDLFALLGPDAQAGGTWSPALSSGNFFNSLVDVAGTYVYTVAGQGPCPDDTASVTVSIVAPPNAGSDALLSTCSNSDITDLFVALGPAAQPGGVWSPALASGTGLFNPEIDPAGIYTYTVAGANPCGSDSATVTVSVTPGPDAGQNGALTLCVNSASQDLFNFLGGTPETGGVWSPALASGTGVFNPAVDVAGVYTYTFFGSQPCDNDTATVTVTVNPIPDAGTDGTAFFCSNFSPADLITFLGGTPQTGGTWFPALASGTGVFNPAVDAPGVYTYSVGGTFCALDTATVTVTVVQSPNAGGPGLTLQVCNTATSLNLENGLNGQQGVGIWTDNSATGALTGSIFNPSQAGVGTYTFTYTVSGGTSPCTTDTAVVTVIVQPQPDAGTFSGVQQVCTSAGTFDLSGLLSGEQSGGVWTIGSNPVDQLLNVVSLLPGSYDLTYTVTNSCGVDSEPVQLIILPAPALSIPNIVLATPICQGAAATVNLTGMPDGNYNLTYTLAGANTLSAQSVAVTVASGNGLFTIPASQLLNPGLTTISFVNITNIATNCSSTLTSIQVNLVVTTAPQLVDANLSAQQICEGSPLVVVITNASAPDGVYQLNYTIPGATPSSGSTFAFNLSSGNGQFSIPAAILAGLSGQQLLNITALVNLTGGCSNASLSASVNFTILDVPSVADASLSGTNSCAGQPLTVIINAPSLADGTYTFNYSLAGVATGSQTSAVAITGGTGNFVIPGTLLSTEGALIITVNDVISVVNPCSSGGGLIPPLTVEIAAPQTPQLIAGGNEFCKEDNPTVGDLIANISTTQPIVWYDAPQSGNVIANDTLLQDGVTYYAASVVGSCESSVRLEVTVVLNTCDEDDIVIPDGFSPNDDGINDEFVVVNLPERYPNFRMQIYNRYGNILYTGNSSTPNWNGRAEDSGVTVGGGLVPVGVYFYIIEFNDGNRKPLQGRLYLSR